MSLDLLQAPVPRLRHEYDGEHEAGGRHCGVHPEHARVAQHRHQVGEAPAVEEDGRVAAAGREPSTVGPDTGGVELTHLILAGFITFRKVSTLTRTQGTGPRPSVKEKVKPRREARGSQAPELVTITELGSCVFRKKIVPNIPMNREHSPVESIRRGRLPAMLRMTVPTVVPSTWTPPTRIVAWNSSRSILASSKMVTVYMMVTMKPDQFCIRNRVTMMNRGIRVDLQNILSHVC